MGNLCNSCFSCCGNRHDDIYENSESDKTNLLGNPVGEPSRQISHSISNKHSLGDIGDQQAKLHQILEKTANSYIDVPALISPMEPPPAEKTRDYGSQIEAALKRRHQQQSTERTSLLEDIPHIERTLSEEPLSVGAREMVKEANSAILAALRSIQVENSENLVIPFEQPKDKM